LASTLTRGGTLARGGTLPCGGTLSRVIDNATCYTKDLTCGNFIFFQKKIKFKN